MPLDIRQKPKSTNTSPQYHSHHNSTVSSPASHKSSGGGGGVQGRRSTFPVSYDRKSTTPQEHKTQLIKNNASPNHSISVGSPSHHRLSKTSIRTTPNKSNTSPLSHHTAHSYNISSTTTSPSHSRLLYQTQSPITTISPNSSNYEVIYSPEIKTLNSTINSPTNSHEVRRSMPLPLSKIDLTSPTNRPLNRLIRTPSPNSIPNSRTPTPLSRPTSTSPSRQTSPRPNPSPRKVNQHTYNTPTRIAHSPSISRGVRKEEYISPAARARSSSIASYNRESPRSQSRERILSPTASSIAKHHNEYELAPSYRNLRYTSPMNKDRRESGPTPISTSNDPNPHRHSPKVGHSRPPVYQYESIDSKSPKYKVIPRGSKSATNSPANKERPSVKRIANTPPPNSGRLSHDLLEKYEESMLDGTRDRSQHYHVIQRSASPMSPKRSEQPLSPNSHGLSYREDVIIDSYASPTHSTSLNRVIISSSPTSYPPTFPKSPNTSRSASPSRTWIFANDPTFILSEQQQQHIIKRSQTTPSPSRCDPPPQVVYDTSWRSSTPPRHEVNDVFDRVQFSPNRTETPTRTNPSPFDYHYVPLERQRWSSSKQLDLVKYATIDTSGSPTTTTVNDIFDSIKSPISVGSSNPKEEIERKYEKPVHRTSEADRMSVTSLGSSGSRGGFKDKISRGRLDEARHVGDGIATGGRFLVDSFARGVSGVVTKPIQGAREDGARGFVTGLGKGVVGLVTKPVRGVVGFTAQTLEGVVNTPSAVRSAMRKKSGEINSPRRSSIVSINSPRRGSIQAINSPTSTESSSMQSDRQQMSA